MIALLPSLVIKEWLKISLLLSMITLLINPCLLHAADNNEFLPVCSLNELEQQLSTPDEVLIAAADLEAGEAQLAQQRSEQGLKLFAGAGTGLTNNTALDGGDRLYTTYELRAGLRYPLLGRADAEERGIVEAQTSVREKEQRLQLVKRQSLSLLRQSYVTYWSAQEKIKLNRAFFTDESRQRQLLTRRQQAGYLLEADRLEFLSAFDLVRRNQETLLAAQRTALHTMQRLTATSVAFTARAPILAISLNDLNGLPESAIETWPSIALLRERLRGLEQQVPLMRNSGANANFDVYTASGIDDTQDAPEYSVGVSLSVELPLGNLAGKGHPAQQSAQALAVKCRRELALERNTIRTRIQEMLALYRASETDIFFATQRLRAAAERVRENGLRTAMEGDSLERLLQSRYAYYQANIDAVDAQARQWNYLISLLEYASTPPEQQKNKQTSQPKTVIDGIDLLLLGNNATDDPQNGLQRDRTPKHKIDAGSVPHGTLDISGLYVWQTKQFKAQVESDPDFLARLQVAGIRRLLLSLDQEQIDALADPSTRAVFSAWLQQSSKRGMKIELLLGEPLWILPEHRPKLLAIIHALADLPFSGLHLDLEPDQLPKQGKQGGVPVKEWVATLKAAKGASPWPLGVSMHPRYFQPPGKRGGLGDTLRRLGVSEVVLMVYVSNPQRVVQLVNPVLKASPGLRFSVAQSVEPELSAEESHSHVGRAQFTARMNRLSPLLHAQNFNGIIVQDWTRWQEMKP